MSSLQDIPMSVNPAFRFDDGGRKAAGYHGGPTGDCGVRAISIVSGIGYEAARQLVLQHAKRERITKRQPKRSTIQSGIRMSTMRRIMEELGFEWRATMEIGSGCQVHLRPAELPYGRIMVRLSRHYSTMINGEIRDTYDCSREGTRCVYGYWYPRR